MKHTINITSNLMVVFSTMFLALVLNKFLDLISLPDTFIYVVFIIAIGLFILNAVLENKRHSRNKHTQ